MNLHGGYVNKRERGPNGELCIHEGMPDLWHYTVQLSNEGAGVYGKIVVMFDGILRVHLWLPRIGTDEEDGIRRSRKKVLEWINDYETRAG
jgi:hypothetical protein